ncbi:MAG: hypothetical protein ACFFDT_07325 [Candidatus Hodarchaeota archaeon]
MKRRFSNLFKALLSRKGIIILSDEEKRQLEKQAYDSGALSIVNLVYTYYYFKQKQPIRQSLRNLLAKEESPYNAIIILFEHFDKMRNELQEAAEKNDNALKKAIRQRDDFQEDFKKITNRILDDTLSILYTNFKSYSQKIRIQAAHLVRNAMVRYYIVDMSDSLRKYALADTNFFHMKRPNVNYIERIPYDEYGRAKGLLLPREVLSELVGGIHKGGLKLTETIFPLLRESNVLLLPTCPNKSEYRDYFDSNRQKKDRADPAIVGWKIKFGDRIYPRILTNDKRILEVIEEVAPTNTLDTGSQSPENLSSESCLVEGEQEAYEEHHSLDLEEIMDEFA